MNLGSPDATAGEGTVKVAGSHGGGRSPSQSHTGCRLRVAWGECGRAGAASSRVGRRQTAGLTEDSKVGPAIVKVAAPNTPEQLVVPAPPSSGPRGARRSAAPVGLAPPLPPFSLSIGPGLGRTASGPRSRSLIGRRDREALEKGLDALFVNLAVAFFHLSHFIGYANVAGGENKGFNKVR